MSEKPNFHQLHEQRNALRTEGRNEGLSEDLITAHEPKEHKEFHIANYGGLGKAKEFLARQRESHNNANYIIDRDAIAESLGEQESSLLLSIEKKSEALISAIVSRTMRLKEMTGNPKKTELYKALMSALNSGVVSKQTELQVLENEHPEIFRIKDLLKYRGQLFQEGHIVEVSSVQTYLSKIEEAMIEGKPMFLHGPTGTGKTSLAIRSAKRLTGKDPEIVYCNPQSKESNIFGKTGISIDERTEKQITHFEYGPLVRAMHEGKIVIFDEFTALPKDMMVMLKGIMNAKVGDRRTVTGDGEVTIAEGFQMIFTANLKSDKNQERQDIPPEMANEFAQNNLKVKYQSEDESYDIMLARLLNQDGTLDMSLYDMEVTLPKLCSAIAEIQRAYTDKIDDSLGGKTSLQKLVFNQRTVENILSRWRTGSVKGEEGDFVTFLNSQLCIPLTFEEYSEKDRTLVAKILVQHGFLSTVKPQDLGLQSDTFSFSPKSSEDSVQKSGKVQHLSLKEVAELDPFNKRRGKIREDAETLLRAIPKPEKSETQMSSQEIAEQLKALGSPAELDSSYEGGVFSLSIPQETVEALKTWKTAKQAFEAADGNSPSWVWDTYDTGLGVQYEPLTTSSLDCVVLNHGQTTQAERKKLLTDMDGLDYRPPTLAEVITVAITHPAFNKRDEYLSTLKEYSLGGALRAPGLDWSDSERDLNANGVGSVWPARSRFLFVRK